MLGIKPRVVIFKANTLPAVLLARTHSVTFFLFVLFCFFVFGLYPVMFRVYSWHCAQDSLLELLRELYIMLGNEPDWPHARQVPSPLYYHSHPLSNFLLRKVISWSNCFFTILKNLIYSMSSSLQGSPLSCPSQCLVWG